MNKIMLIGRLTKNPEMHTSQTGTAIARYTLAVNRPYNRGGDQPKADFIRCIVFGKLAEFTENYLYKGIKVAVTGRIQTGSYTNREGQTVYTTSVIVEECEFCERRADNSNPGSANHSQPDYAPENADRFMNIPDGIDDELPFN